jgi:hypothetical protein
MHTGRANHRRSLRSARRRVVQRLIQLGTARDQRRVLIVVALTEACDALPTSAKTRIYVRMPVQTGGELAHEMHACEDDCAVAAARRRRACKRRRAAAAAAAARDVLESRRHAQKIIPHDYAKPPTASAGVPRRAAR